MTAPVDALERRRRAAAAFACTTGELAAGLARFAGLEQPHGEAEAVLEAALDLVAGEPELPDWLELARAWRWYGRLHPRTEPEVLAPPTRSVLEQIRGQVAGLDRETLRETALALVPQAWLLDALEDALAAQTGAPEDEAGAPTAEYTWHVELDDNRIADLTVAAEHELHALTMDPAQAWGPAAHTALGCALLWRLASLGGIFAEVAGMPSAPPLAWQEATPAAGRQSSTCPAPRLR